MAVQKHISDAVLRKCPVFAQLEVRSVEPPPAVFAHPGRGSDAIVRCTVVRSFRGEELLPIGAEIDLLVTARVERPDPPFLPYAVEWERLAHARYLEAHLVEAHGELRLMVGDDCPIEERPSDAHLWTAPYANASIIDAPTDTPCFPISPAEPSPPRPRASWWRRLLGA